MSYAYKGKTYKLVPVTESKDGNSCNGCAFDNDIEGCLSSPDCGFTRAFDNDIEGCLSSPDCGFTLVFVEGSDDDQPEREPCKGPNCGTTTFNHSKECHDAHDEAVDDWLKDSKACDRFDPDCEACQ